MAPGLAELTSRVGLVVVAFAGFVFWPGWTVWAVLLWLLGAWRGLPASGLEAPSPRALGIGILTAITLILCFMATPIETETVAWTEMRVLDQEGREVPAAELSNWWKSQANDH